MTEPVTVNGGLIIPNTGDLVGTWGSTAVNPDLVALDGALWGVQTISVSSTNVILTSPSFTPTPSAGPTQCQNAVLAFTGALTANVQVTLPIPGFYIIDNQTTGAFVLSFRAIGAGKVIGVAPGEVQHIYNDGTNVKFANLGRVGATEIWAGYSAIPAWVAACTTKPYLLCDGSVYNYSDYPALGPILGSKFGGNGVSTFGVPDLQGRYPIPYDGTGTRITTAGCGINGQTIGAAGGVQDFTLAQNQLPNIAPTIDASSAIWNTASFNKQNFNNGSGGALSAVITILDGSGGGATNVNSKAGLIGGSITASSINGNVTQLTTPNVAPAQVTGIAVIRAG